MTNINKRLALLASVALPLAFENKAGWKMDGDKLALDASGNPIYLDSSGREMSVDGGTITRLNGEAKSHRERAEKAEATAKAFEGLSVEDARKALETVKKLDDKKLIDAGEVDKVRDEVSKGFQARLDEMQKTADSATQRADNLTRENAFAKSKFLTERVAIPADMLTAAYNNNFKIEDGKLVPYGPDGNKLYSKKRMGEIADVDEALELLVETRADKDMILKAPDTRGSGNGGGGGARGGGRYMSRADFAKLNPAQQAESAALMQKGELTVTD